MFVIRTLAEIGRPLVLLGITVRITNSSMRPYIHPQLRLLLDLAGGLELAARELAKAARKRMDARKPRSGRGATLRPSAETPLWNAIATLVKPQLARRGDRALLARELGVHRARIGEYFDTNTAMPDAERALQILIWIARKERKTQSGSDQK